MQVVLLEDSHLFPAVPDKEELVYKLTKICHSKHYCLNTRTTFTCIRTRRIKD